MVSCSLSFPLPPSLSLSLSSLSRSRPPVSLSRSPALSHSSLFLAPLPSSYLPPFSFSLHALSLSQTSLRRSETKKGRLCIFSSLVCSRVSSALFCSLYLSSPASLAALRNQKKTLDQDKKRKGKTPGVISNQHLRVKVIFLHLPYFSRAIESVCLSLSLLLSLFLFL